MPLVTVSGLVGVQIHVVPALCHRVAPVSKDAFPVGLDVGLNVKDLALHVLNLVEHGLSR